MSSTIRRGCRKGCTCLRRLRGALTRSTVIADDRCELRLECLAFCESHRGRECEIVAVAIILEANFEAHLSGAFFGGEECCEGVERVNLMAQNLR